MKARPHFSFLFKLAPIALLLLQACTLAPFYETPSLPVAETFPAQLQNENTRQHAANMGWREFFKDDQLKKLIELALKNNRDLRIATLNVDKASATHHIARADLLPKINGVAQESAQRLPDNMRAQGASEISRTYSAGLSTTAFEVDLFGRVRSLNNAAFARYLASDAARKAAQIALIAEVANAWSTLQADEAHLIVAQKTLETQQKAYQLIEKSFELGAVSELVLQQAKTTVESARFDEARYVSITQQDKNLLTFLVGTPISDAQFGTPFGTQLGEQINTKNTANLPIFAASFAELPVSLSSEILLLRPDIAAAEHNLIAANANIGAARAAFFPLISLTATVGTTTRAIDDLFTAGTRFWNFTPSLVLPIFQAGRNLANLDIAHAQKSIEIAQYEKSIQSAFREVADLLADKSTLNEQRDTQNNLQRATQKTFELSNARYLAGASRFLEALDAQRTNYAAQQSQINVVLAQLRNQISLYKALGGGILENTQSTEIKND